MRWSDKRAAWVVAAVHESAFGTKRTWRRVSYFVRFRGKADMGRRIVPMISDAIDPYVWSGRALQEDFSEFEGCGGLASMYGPAVRCKKTFPSLRAVAVLHQCIRPLIGAFVLRAIMGISARAISLADRPQWTMWVTSVRMRREDRSSISFLILSQTLAG